jgi:VanZ family protein
MPGRLLIARVSLWLPPLAYMALIFYLSSQLNPMPEITSRVWDKLLHGVEYAGLALLFCRALTGEGLRWTMAAPAAVLLTSAYGASDEYHQLLVPLRNSNVRDWIADTIGAALGAALYRGATTPSQPASHQKI